MVLGVMQPYLFPYLGYYQLVYHCDKFVFYDDVNYIKGGHINRNNILTANGIQRFTLPVRNASPNTLIKDLSFESGAKKILRSIEQSYRRSPYFSEIYPVLVEVFESEYRSVPEVTSNSIIRVFEYLELEKEFTFSSQITYARDSNAKEKLWSLCKYFDIYQYCNSEGGKTLYDKTEFSRRGIELSFLRKQPVSYSQGGRGTDFFDDLSMIDVLMWNSKDDVIKLLSKYDII